MNCKRKKAFREWIKQKDAILSWFMNMLVIHQKPPKLTTNCSIVTIIAIADIFSTMVGSIIIRLALIHWITKYFGTNGNIWWSFGYCFAFHCADYTWIILSRNEMLSDYFSFSLTTLFAQWAMLTTFLCTDKVQKIFRSIWNC